MTLEYQQVYFVFAAAVYDLGHTEVLLPKTISSTVQMEDYKIPICPSQN